MERRSWLDQMERVCFSAKRLLSVLPRNATPLSLLLALAVAYTAHKMLQPKSHSGSRKFQRRMEMFGDALRDIFVEV